MPLEQIAGADLFYEVAGAGEPVLLLHGGFCSLESLREQADALATTHEVHAFERPGHGRSPDVGDPYSYAQGVEQALAYLDANDLGAVHVIGYSDGAIVGLLLALEHPDRVRSLISISGNLDPSGFTHSPEAARATTLDELPAHDRPNVERELYDRLSPDGAEHGDVVLEKLFALWMSEPHIDPTSLRAITAPTLIVSGDRDTIRPDHSLLIASSIPGARLCIVPGAGHDLVTEKSGFISAVIRDFLTA